MGVSEGATFPNRVSKVAAPTVLSFPETVAAVPGATGEPELSKSSATKTPRKLLPTIAPAKLSKTIETLNRIGAINYTPETQLTKWQKHNLKVKAQQYAHVLQKPNEFKVFDIDSKSVKAFKDSGLEVTGKRRAVVPLKDFDDVKLEGKNLIYTGKNPRGKRIKETVTLSQSGEFHAKLKELSEIKLKRNQFLSVKIGDNARFSKKFSSYADLFHYVQNVFEPKDRGQSKAKLMRLMSIVEIEEKAPNAKQKTKGTPTKTRSRKTNRDN